MGDPRDRLKIPELYDQGGVCYVSFTKEERSMVWGMSSNKNTRCFHIRIVPRKKFRKTRREVEGPELRENLQFYLGYDYETNKPTSQKVAEGCVQDLYFKTRRTNIGQVFASSWRWLDKNITIDPSNKQL